MKGPGKELIYLYCVTDSPRSWPGDEKYTISCRDFYAVVGKARKTDFGEENLKKNLADFEWLKEKVNIHEQVIENVMKESSVVPFKFATIFNNEDNLIAFLKENEEELGNNLNYFRGKEEWGIKIYCDMAILMKYLGVNNEEILSLKNAINTSPPGKAFFLKKQKEEILIREANKKINEYGQHSFNKLKKYSIQSVINKLLPGEVTEINEDMILNCAFLLDKCLVTPFITAVEELKEQTAGTGFIFDCTGPWPPYNFCKLKKSGTAE